MSDTQCTTPGLGVQMRREDAPAASRAGAAPAPISGGAQAGRHGDLNIGTITRRLPGDPPG